MTADSAAGSGGLPLLPGAAIELQANPCNAVNNTVVNNNSSGTFVHNANATSALLENNIFLGNGTILSGTGTQTTNWATTSGGGIDLNTIPGATSTVFFTTTSGSATTLPGWPNWSNRRSFQRWPTCWKRGFWAAASWKGSIRRGPADSC